MESVRLNISPRMRQILDYPKFSGPPRMLILETQYFFDQSWQRAAEQLGWEVHSVKSTMVGDLTRDDIQSLFLAVGQFKPDFILASNFGGMDVHGMFSHFFEDARIPYVSWFTDTPRMILHGREACYHDYMVAATWERSYIPHFEKLGFTRIHYMPLATDPDLFNGEPQARCERQLAFVGTSMIEETNEAWEKLGHLPEAIEAINHVLDTGACTRQRFTQGIDAFLPPEILQGRNASERRNIELAVIYEATRRQRVGMVKHLEPLGIDVHGDPEWTKITPRARGTVGYFNDLAPFYRSTAVNLNITSLQMEFAVNQRVFDCPAAAGFLITDNQGDIDHLFEPETEMVTFATLDELEDKAKYYLAHPEARLPFIQRAQARVLAHHTHRNRLEDLETFLKEHYGE